MQYVQQRWGQFCWLNLPHSDSELIRSSHRPWCAGPSVEFHFVVTLGFNPGPLGSLGLAGDEHVFRQPQKLLSRALSYSPHAVFSCTGPRLSMYTRCATYDNCRRRERHRAFAKTLAILPTSRHKDLSSTRWVQKDHGSLQSQKPRIVCTCMYTYIYIIYIYVYTSVYIYIYTSISI